MRIKLRNDISCVSLVVHRVDWIRKEDLVYAINNGVKKINIGPELRIVIGEAILKGSASPNFDVTDYRILMNEVADSLFRYLKNKMSLI